jgi:hypothetical protein
MKMISIALFFLISFSFTVSVQRVPPRPLPLKTRLVNIPERKIDGMRIHRQRIRIKNIHHNRINTRLIMADTINTY